ncbi:MAG: BamA/TamA family outer membrane protein [Candidatus Latescibacterota bacterium]
MPDRRPVLLLLCLVLATTPVEGQLYHFGRNKVQFAEFRWQRLETAHFDVYFFAEEEELAGYAARMAEDGYARLQRLTGHTVERGIPLIVYSSHLYFEQTNVIPDLLPEGVGGFTEFLKGRVALPLSGSLPEFERVLHHELVHVFTFDRIRRVLRRHGIHEYRSPPLWFSEGLAEYWSTEEPGALAGMVLGDALFGDRLVPISQMQYIDGTFLMYKEGESICRYLAATHGEDVFGLLLDNWWRAEEFGGVLVAVTGDSLSGLDLDWQYDLRKRYLPQIAGADLPGRLATPLTDGGFNLKPEVLPGRPDSASFVFFRNHRGYTHIARASVNGGPAEVVVEGERSPVFESLHPLATRPAASPDGRWLAFAAQHRGRDRLYIWDLTAGRLARELSFDEVVAIATPTWSPDGRSLVFSGADQGGFVDLYRVDLKNDGGIGGNAKDDERAVPLLRDLYDDRDPAWSPDGRWLAFTSDRWSGGAQGHHNLFLFELASGAVYAMDPGRWEDRHPSWSPDGKELAFSSDRDSVSNLYAVRLDLQAADRPVRGPIRRLTRVLTGAFDPVWVPGRRTLLFSGYEEAAFQVYRLDLAPDSLETVPATQALSRVDGTAWRPEILADGIVSRREYQRRLTLDIVQSQISQDPEFGTSGGIQLGLSDVLGDDQYYFVLSHIAGSETGFADGLNLAMARVHQGRRVNSSWGIFRLNDRLSSSFGRFVREQRLGGYLELSYPFSVHDRVETRFSLRQAEIDRQFEGRRLDGLLATNFLSYTHDSSLWIPTGPLEGRRYSLGVGQTVDLRSSRRFNLSLYGDYRHYLRLSRRGGLALRALGWRSQGDVPEYFSMGGSWTLRGYPWRSIWGSRLILLNQELRFPLLDRLVIGFPFGDIDFSSLRGALFTDAGNAWSESFGEWKGSVGAGMRLALGGVFVFRLDAARRTDFKSLDNDTRWEFFFGWDY